MQTRLITLTTPAPLGAVFNYLADIENLPVWTGGLCEWIELHREGWWAYTVFGELAVETKVDDISGVIDLNLRHVSGWSMIIPLRVRSDGECGALIHASCRQTAGMADEDFERLFDALLTGLRELPAQLHPERAVA